MLKLGVDLSVPDASGNTVIHILAQQGNKALMQVLLNKQSPGPSVINSRNKRGETALVLAAIREASEVVRLLLDHDADASTESQRDGTPLYAAVNHGYVSIVQILTKVLD